MPRSGGVLREASGIEAGTQQDGRRKGGRDGGVREETRRAGRTVLLAERRRGDLVRRGGERRWSPVGKTVKGDRSARTNLKGREVEREKVEE